MRGVRALIVANYTWCTGKAPFNIESVIIDHAYGWTPFVTDPDKPATPVPCPNQPTMTHLLEDTPGYWEPTGVPNQKDYAKYQAVKQKFDDLQYWPDHNAPNGDFDPYLLLIHGKDYINTDYAYAYSVDDALGNMQVAGDGLIIAVGGTNGLPNPKPATPPINVAMGYNSTEPGWINFTSYGVCKTTPDTTVDPTFASFAISANDPQKCPLSFKDASGALYYITLKAEPPYALGPPAPDVPVGQQYYPNSIDCTDNAPNTQQAAWCRYPPHGHTVDYGAQLWTVKGTGNAKTNTNTLNLRSACQPFQKPNC